MSLCADQPCRSWIKSRVNADSTILQLEDPFGYDKADIKVDAIVEDLRVCIVLSTTPTSACAFAKTQAHITKRNTNMIN
jgi:predicted membrane chloride channel (bestrophin family)